MSSRNRKRAHLAPCLFILLSSSTACSPTDDQAEEFSASDVAEASDLAGPESRDLDTNVEDSGSDSEPDIDAPEPFELPTCEELLDGAVALPGHQAGPNVLPAFVDSTETLGLPTMYGMTASWGDINSDGLIDLFVPGWVAEPSYQTRHRPERFDSIFLGCGDRFFEHRIELSGTYPFPGSVGLTPDASHVADMDGDGREDLLVTVFGDLYIYYQTAFGFESSLIWPHRGNRAPIFDLTVVDINQDGRLDVYGSVYGGANLVLEGTETRGAFVDHSFDDDDHAAATSVETYAAAFIPRRDAGEPALLYLAHHAEPDQIWTIDEEFQLQMRVAAIPPFASMGVDYFYPAGDERVVAAVSEEGNVHHIYRIDAESAESTQTEGLFPDGITEWGVRFSDFNNDGGMDLVYACAPASYARTEDEIQPEFHLKLAMAEQERRGELGWVDASATAGPSFDGTGRPNYYGLGAADFDLDGCVDLVIAPAKFASNNPESVSYFGPITVLRNSCAYSGNWIGFLLEDPGAMVGLDINVRGVRTRLWSDSQAGSSVGGESASEQVHLGLGEADSLLGLEVRCRDGRTTTRPGSELALNAYNDIRTLCPSGPEAE